MSLRRTDEVTKDSQWAEALLVVLMNPRSWEILKKDLPAVVAKTRKELEGLKRKPRNPCRDTISRVMKDPDFQDRVREARRERMVAAMPAVEVGMVNAAVLGSPQAYDRVKAAAGEGRLHPVDGGTVSDMTDDKLARLARNIIERKEGKRCTNGRS